jgi:2-oxoisovalerate dehydrogenase E1 component beta subunit
MAELTMVQALQDGLATALREDPNVLILGEDVGQAGGVFRVTDGLLAEFGEKRVLDTPLCENGIVGAAVGMAIYGLKPVVEIQFSDFIYPAFDQIASELAKFRYRSAGQYSTPVVVRAPVGGGIKGGLYHSQSPEAYFAHTPGLKVITPSTPRDAKGLLLAAIADPDPVIFLEPKRLYRTIKEEVPEGSFTEEIGKARVARRGDAATVLTYGSCVPVAVEAAGRIREKSGHEVEVIDIRTLVPLDAEAVLGSVTRTGRVVIVHEAPRTCGYGAELAALISERALTRLEAPIGRVAGFDTPFPYTLEHAYLPDAGRIAGAIDYVIGF